MHSSAQVPCILALVGKGVRKGSRLILAAESVKTTTSARENPIAGKTTLANPQTENRITYLAPSNATFFENSIPSNLGVGMKKGGTVGRQCVSKGLKEKEGPKWG